MRKKETAASKGISTEIPSIPQKQCLTLGQTHTPFQSWASLPAPPPWWASASPGSGNTRPAPHPPGAHPLIPASGLIVQQGLPWSLDRHRLIPAAPISALRAVSVPSISAAGARGTGTERSRGGPGLLTTTHTPPAPHVPAGASHLPRPPGSPVLSGAAGVARLVGVARVLGLGVHGVGTPCLVALQGHRLGPLGGPHSHLLQHWLLQAEGHLQEINRHPEGLYLAGRVGLSQRKSSDGPWGEKAAG